MDIAVEQSNELVLRGDWGILYHSETAEEMETINTVVLFFSCEVIMYHSLDGLNNKNLSSVPEIRLPRSNYWQCYSF